MNKNKNTITKNQQYPAVNRKFKNDIFCLIFKSKIAALSLYNALNNSHYDNEDDLEINTLEDVIYLSVKNDVSFLIGGTMNLYEHQSTFNPNMPVRGFLYLARLYEQYIELHSINLYSGVLKKLPSPQYIVFYNGTEYAPDESVLRLSDSFHGNTATTVPCLECTATMLNINYGHNKILMEKCRHLEEYAFFVSTVRKYVSTGNSLEKAVTQAVNYCIRQNILKDILLKNKSEVVSMVLTSFNREKYEKAMQEEWKELGLAEGRVQGLERVNLLNKLLIENSRMEDLCKSAEDSSYQEKLFREFGI